MQYLRRNTAVIVAVGPFLDKADGVTLETGLTITNERITLVAETDDGSAPTNVLDNVTGATSGTSNDLNYITGNDAGMMQLELAAADTNRLGRMRLIITDAANHCPVFHEYCVLPADLYDTMFTANANRGGVIASGTIGSTGNSTTALHLTGLTYGDDEINDLLLVVKDVSTNERHARWIDDWADTGDLATVATLPFTPENAVDTYEILATRRDAVLANGKAHGGTTATLILERAIIASTTSNEPGLKITGNGTAAGTLSTGGATGPGIDAVGGGTSGAGMRTRAAAGNSIGLDAVGAGSGEGIKATGGATGEGIEAVGGATSGSGFKGTGKAGNAVGIEGQGQGSADGVRGTGGATGHGINGIGGATSGSGLRGVGTAGNSSGVAAVGQGSAAGLQATGGATGAGIRGTGGATSGAGLVAAAAAGNSDGATFTPAGTGLGMNYTNTVAGRIKKNTAFTNFMIKMELTDGSPGTGLTVTVQRAIDGGAFAALAVTTVTEISAGWYKFNLAAADVNGDSIAIKATATGAKQLDLLILTQVAG